MKKIIFIACVLLFSFSAVKSQQLAQVSQFFSTGLLYNPAVAGSTDGIPVFGLVRRQWVNIENAPVTQTIAGHGHAGESMGLGGMIFNDATGPSRLTGLSFSVARHFNLKEDSRGGRGFSSNALRLSLGLSAQLFQYSIDLDKVTFDIENDPVKDKSQDGNLTPDMSFGSLLYNNDFSVGFSVPQLFQTKVDLFDIPEQNENELRRQFMFTSEYKFKANSKTMIIPAILAKYLPGAPIQAEINVRYQHSFDTHVRNRREADVRARNIWAGASYRTGDAIVLMVGLNQDFFNFGYSYDITVSNVRNYSSGTHELFLGMLLKNALKKK